MNLDATGIQIVLVLAVICFVLEAFRDRPIGLTTVRWWALGVAFYLFSLAAA